MFSSYFSVKKCWNEENTEKGAKRTFLKFVEKNENVYLMPSAAALGLGRYSTQPRVESSQDAKQNLGAVAYPISCFKKENVPKMPPEEP